MKKSGIILASIVGIVILIGSWIVSVNNSLIKMEESVTGAWSQVENVYQRRADLIPNLVSTVKGYAAHERETLQAVVEARAAAVSGTGQNLDAASLKKFQATQDGLSSALSRLMVVVEKYPDLKANQNFLELQSQLEGTENRIAVERRRFNEITQEYNTSIKLFPRSIVAGFRGMAPKTYFTSNAGADKAPEVKF